MDKDAIDLIRRFRRETLKSHFISDRLTEPSAKSIVNDSEKNHFDHFILPSIFRVRDATESRTVRIQREGTSPGKAHQCRAKQVNSSFQCRS